MYFMGISRLKRDPDPATFREVLSAHVAWIERCIASGEIVQAGKWGDRSGMAIIKADDHRAAEGRLREDPLAASGLVSWELDELFPCVEFRPEAG